MPSLSIDTIDMVAVASSGTDAIAPEETLAPRATAPAAVRIEAPATSRFRPVMLRFMMSFLSTPTVGATL
jgi:hypothetical protein